MKIFKRIILCVALVVLFTSPTWAASGDKLSFQASPGNSCSQTAGQDNFRIDDCGRIVEAADGTTMGYIALPLTSFTQEGTEIPASGSGAYIGSSLGYDLNHVSGDEAQLGTVNGNQVIRLSKRSKAPIEASFRVPDDYYQNGDFRVKVISNENYHAGKLKFAVRRHTNTTVDTTDSVETDVSLSASPGGATVAELELNPTSDFSSLAAGNWVTIKVRRGPKLGGVVGDEDLDIYNFVFRYERKY